ncbi:3-deoxy-7-phosphoheptulonate synthase [Dickeya lacustris]|uniref:Phospho-2-dehydro-3-deoxyheptonate aldolase n=1 Tax=Dickeya lacustris TaxID=2259638 RepID=A0ABY8G983_9GAMM|nr:3-deoxy-7-phosphoheptulonate synthase [Dickeya lacustris]WFN56470.1 3-deoxy-7-phosphoheptulonate synthase [Dickeya lacustris]
MQPTDELRSERLTRLVTPHELLSELPLTPAVAETIIASRTRIEHILSGQDNRLLVIIGPCSIHHPDSAREYAAKLAMLRTRYQSQLEIVMRAYFEKPRTVVGWKGLIADPQLDGSFQVNEGLRQARRLLLDINALGLPTATEFLDIVTGQYIADTISWGAIGARTTESQIHREMASALSCPVGFKNGTDGNVRIAIDAIRAARSRHMFLSPDKQGHMTVYQTHGNPFGHIILRGGKTPNYEAEHITRACLALREFALPERLVVDFSHGNSQKQFKRQLSVAQAICEQMRAGSQAIAGVMVESFLREGAQPLEHSAPLTYGQSVTDACLGWQDSEQLLDMLAEASAHRLRAI